MNIMRWGLTALWVFSWVGELSAVGATRDAVGRVLAREGVTNPQGVIVVHTVLGRAAFTSPEDATRWAETPAVHARGLQRYERLRRLAPPGRSIEHVMAWEEVRA